ncbi:hypothetical protein M8J76_007080 [Diaphorina citri]|nr:hypothetical protein M8J75_005493 [Diaphorina citri]KAI5716475.1 hypothetical protein M8J76_007080 [Diaphorina citri]KAI5718219.1 hypothetical protein M8J77_018196 [Diaphorina citri]
MQSLTWTGRLISRALWNSLTNNKANEPSNAKTIKKEAKLFSAVSGIPKDFSNNKMFQLNKYGDDAYFTARYKTADVLGVADGVGGWRNYGIDPGEFSSFLMKTCERLVTSGRFSCTEPTSLLARSYYELLENKQPILGSSTACIVILNKETSTLYTANIGDSGFVIVRRGKVIHRSEEQQHYFNTPFQLSLPPLSHTTQVLGDRPECADTSQFQVEDGDVILLATDGVFDNVPDSLLLAELVRAQGSKDPMQLQLVANTIALMARTLAFDETYMSPFAIQARANGISTQGGKPDDITVLLAIVAL